ncbi:MAG: trypsin-like peptidase domain-containing protein [Patescibacteria group bacterium]|nr:trypsin-like peptidase domain-containing protein [Patescibacteria group bacterium]
MRKLIVLVVILILLLAFVSGGKNFVPDLIQEAPGIPEKVKILTEESVVTSAVKNVGPSVVTVSEQGQTQTTTPFDFGPFSFEVPQEEQTEPQNIGSGFIVDQSGLIVTNKHVVSDPNSKYQIITNNDKKYDIKQLYRDPSNDIAIIKIDPEQNPGQSLKSVTLGDSSKLQVGQFVIAIGTALGEFKNTVTTGVISGLGRGITAGSQFQGFVEKLDNVIQTDAAINPGNSGGPLLNSSGQVIGINTAVAAVGQNIGFALPISVVKDSLKNFNETGQFDRAYLGVSYRIINRDMAVMNELPEGAYVSLVVTGSAADKAGIKRGDIITKINGDKISAQNEISTVISKTKVGQTITVTLWREGKTSDIKVTLESASTG